MISICDLIGCFAMTWGYPKHEFACRLQGFLNFFFFRASWLWTAAAAACTTFLQIHYGYIPKYCKFRYWNLYIWSLSIILEFLPISLGDSYGGCMNGSNFGHLLLKGKDASFDVMFV
jgi:hypothetical protein